MSVYRAAGGRRVALRGPPIGPEQAVEFKGDERLARGRRWREVAGCTAFEAMLASDAAATSPVITTARAQASWPSPHRVPHLASKRHWLTFRSEGYFATVDRLTRSTRDLLNTLATITEKKKARFPSLAGAWADTMTAHGRLMLTVLAEFERELIRAPHRRLSDAFTPRIEALCSFGRFAGYQFRNGIFDPSAISSPRNGPYMPCCISAAVTADIARSMCGHGPTITRRIGRGPLCLIDSL